MVELPKLVSNIMEVDDKLVLLTASSKIGIANYGGKKCKGVYIPFVFGEKAMQHLLDMNFECQNCGVCCQNDGEFCESIVKKGEKNYCSRYYNKRPLACLTYPFMIDEPARRGYGYMVLIDEIEGATRMEFGLVDEAITLQVFPSAKHWTGSTPLRNLYRDSLLKLANNEDDSDLDSLFPPLKTLSEYIGMPQNITKKEGKAIEESQKRFFEKIKAMRPRFLEELGNI